MRPGCLNQHRDINIAGLPMETSLSAKKNAVRSSQYVIQRILMAQRNEIKPPSPHYAYLQNSLLAFPRTNSLQWTPRPAKHSLSLTRISDSYCSNFMFICPIIESVFVNCLSPIYLTGLVYSGSTEAHTLLYTLFYYSYTKSLSSKFYLFSCTPTTHTKAEKITILRLISFARADFGVCSRGFIYIYANFINGVT